MKKSRTIPSNTAITFFLLILISLTIFGVGVSSKGVSVSSKKNGQEDIVSKRQETINALRVEDIKITNRTSAFHIESVEKVAGGNIKLKLKNGYNNIITAYQVSFGSTTTTTDHLNNPNMIGIKPGEVIEHLEPIEVDPHLYKKGLVILAVILDDGSSDGNSQSVREINEHRLGQMMQIERAHELLQPISSSDEENFSDQLDAIKPKLLSKDDPAYKDLSDSAKFGLSDAKDRLTRYIDKIIQKNNSEEKKNGLEGLVNYCENKAKTFRIYREAVTNKQTKQ